MTGIIFPHNGLIKKKSAAGGGGAGVTYTDQAVNPANQSSYTFSSLDFGPEDASRVIVIGVAARALTSVANITSVTIDGAPMANVNHISNSANYAGLWALAKPTDGANQVVVTFSVSVDRCGIIVWQTIGMSGATALDSGTAAIASGTGNSAGDTLTTANGGCAIGFVSGTASSGGTDFVWTNLSQDYEGAIETNVPYGGASANTTGSSLAITCQANFSISTSGPLVVASWEP